ncbi:GSCOCG00001440001-RA-CDS [Cotesia congregata]|uniref:phospholipase A1 n=1 Tax=Cotesia congregata TaxID=51543 RepID=A0A8J2ELA0_COTCN|nr:GSCOCG00001440001-RA-CDS [Cotesia congregata]CAG5076782.1 Similar to pla1a: Phospholipase A1 member A (Danio rerio) [Cotesia congregata]
MKVKIFSVFLLLIFISNVLSRNILPESENMREKRELFTMFCANDPAERNIDQGINFHLFTTDWNSSELIVMNDTQNNLKDTKFNPKNPTKIIVHGYNADMNLFALVDMRHNYLNKSQILDNQDQEFYYNVIAVDWERLAAGCYPVVVEHAKKVGDRLAELIHELVLAGAEDIHAIGFSLGAHVPAFAANSLRTWNYKLPRITGLDPAMPLFMTVGLDGKLDAGDAKFVDVYHTDAMIQGKLEPCGHVDFYMNGGMNQPGCNHAKSYHNCNHLRAAEYFAESVTSKVGFWGWKCSSFASYFFGYCTPVFPLTKAGEEVDQRVRGLFVVRTNAESPYAKFNIM